jgi:hypothetical protein
MTPFKEIKPCEHEFIQGYDKTVCSKCEQTKEDILELELAKSRHRCTILVKKLQEASQALARMNAQVMTYQEKLKGS